MSSTYGSDNPDCVRVDHLDEIVPARSTSAKWKKAALVTAGAALCLGGALVMYKGWNAPFSATVTRSTSPLTEMNLKSAAVSTDQTNLMSGLPVLLRVKGKANLCADDGGATKADTTYITNQPCNPSNPNQLFIYDSTKSQFKSAKKENLCIDTGGGLAGLTWLRLSKCSTKKNDDQIFTYDPSTLMVSVSKNTCMTDGGGDEAGDSHYTIWGCSTKNANMRFEVLSQSALAAEQKTILDAVAGGAKFLLRIVGKAGLCASGSGTTAASTSFTPAVCDKQSKDQLFSYDASINRIRSSEKKGLCLDDGGAKKAKVDLRLANCSAASADQTFAYDPTTLMFSQPNKAKLCLDDGTSFWFKAPRLVLKDCDPYSKDQHFEFVLQTDPVTTPTAIAPTTTTTTTAASVIDTPVATTASPVAADTTTTSSTQVSATSATQQAPVTTAYETPATSSTPPQPETPTAYQQESTESTTAPRLSQYATVSATESSTASTENTHFTTTTTGVALPQVNQMTPTTSTTDPAMTMSKENDMMTTSATQPGATTSKENDMMTTSAMEPGATMAKENDMMTTSAKEPGTTMTKENGMMTTSATLPGTTTSKENDMMTTSAMDPGATMAKENDMKSTSVMEPGMTMTKENEMMTTSAKEPGTTMTKENGMMTTSATQPGTAMSKENDMMTTPGMGELYLQSLKDSADLEHQAVMYRYKRTFKCATAGMQTLVKDSVTAEEFKVLVRWMYEHCAAGYTNIETPAMPSLPISVIDSADVAPLVNDPKTDVQRQFMTKIDFYYEIKNYFAETSEKLNGEMAAAHLRTGETKELETKMLDCIDEASERFGFKANAQAYATTENLKAAIAWVEDSCMKP
ncbi:hypothetical protein PF002_g24290 [Phytophthora fragariae]|uniref:Ricin B lectin domain-containing protein n=1 Tax=Phytophthora fragariae TaxID=53985 RepID=A0A6A3ILE2_9STRA|nr:hypothetical protein PF003_g4274 [Phytophthora fragariae]KAE8925794.1 hypothetical protein PF009_g24006 [Phytophthora fragariae]KAE8981355.1 hypothetical protein PF011_g22052 [Phytophthora fragariae]KAE9101957.1 hypothetical protein PF006_g22556 [Phytophthora fragariae]KAE9192130.1 hypothetical protein PF002_g24290 [Phytophthora fragariae]